VHRLHRPLPLLLARLLLQAAAGAAALPYRAAAL
jgi:hypothetical protein